MWKERNLVVFHNKAPNPTWIVKSALNLRREFIYTNSAKHVSHIGSKHAQLSFIWWRSSKAGFVKLNFDGFVVNQGAAAGFVIRNENG